MIFINHLCYNIKISICKMDFSCPSFYCRYWLLFHMNQRYDAIASKRLFLFTSYDQFLIARYTKVNDQTIFAWTFAFSCKYNVFYFKTGFLFNSFFSNILLICKCWFFKNNISPYQNTLIFQKKKSLLNDAVNNLLTSRYFRKESDDFSYLSSHTISIEIKKQKNKKTSRTLCLQLTDAILTIARWLKWWLNNVVY